MSYSPTYLPSASGAVPCLSLAALVAAGAAIPSHASSSLCLDCRALPYQHTLGVCHQLSELLLLRRKGFRVSLYQANPVLRRCLHLLQVAHLFTWVA